MMLEDRFRSELLGFFSPGRPIAVRAENLLQRPQEVFSHEAAHYSITRNSTLGCLAFLCGLINVYSTDPKSRRASSNYIKSFCSKSFWVQEGAATAIQRLHLPSEDLACPRCYGQAEIDIHSIGLPALASFPMILSESYFGRVNTYIAVALAALSPPINSDLIRAALAGHTSRFMGSLSATWARFQALLRCRMEKFDGCISQRKALVAEGVCFKPERFMLDVAAWLCQASGLTYSCPPDFMELVDSFAPDLKSFVRIVQNEEFDNFNFYATYHVLVPREHALATYTIRDIARIEGPPQSTIVVVEAAVDDAHRPVSIVHAFSGAGDHTISYMVYSDSPSRELFEGLTLSFVQQHQSECRGIVVGIEALRDHLEHVLDGLPVVRLPMFNWDPSDIVRAERICQSDEVELQRLFLRNKESFWHVSASGLWGAGRPMTVEERCYAWVLQSGVSARTRWTNLYGATEA